MTFHIDTPLIESTQFSLSTQRSILLKMEALQPTGSFKIRGIGLACKTYAERGAKRFISSSGGNAGLAVAYVGRKLGIKVTVVVPSTTSERAKSLLYQEGASVLTKGTSWLEANAYAMSLNGPMDAFIHPFDDPLLWKGHSSIIDEVVRAGFRPDAVIVTVGGGGLLCGIAEGLRRHGMTETQIIAVETEGAESFNRTLHAGDLVSLPAIRSMATSLGAKQVCRQAFEYGRTHPVTSVVVSDHAAFLASKRFLDDHRVLVEPACGAGLSILYDNSAPLEQYNQILVIVCGGCTTTAEDIQIGLNKLAPE